MKSALEGSNSGFKALALALAVTLASMVCRPVYAFAPHQSSTDPTLTRLLGISKGIRSGGKFLRDDKAFVIRSAKSSVLKETYVAMLILAIAVEKKQYPLQDYMQIVEEKTCRSTPEYAWIFAGLYPRHPQDDVPLKAILVARKGLETLPSFKDRNGTAKNLSHEEVDLCDSYLRNKDDVIRLLVSNLFASKRGLDPGSRAWILNRIDREIKRGGGDVREYWQFVRRVVVFRNPRR